MASTADLLTDDLLRGEDDAGYLLSEPDVPAQSGGGGGGCGGANGCFVRFGSSDVDGDRILLGRYGSRGGGAVGAPADGLSQHDEHRGGHDGGLGGGHAGGGHVGCHWHPTSPHYDIKGDAAASCAPARPVPFRLVGRDGRLGGSGGTFPSSGNDHGGDRAARRVKNRASVEKCRQKQRAAVAAAEAEAAALAAANEVLVAYLGEVTRLGAAVERLLGGGDGEASIWLH